MLLVILQLDRAVASQVAGEASVFRKNPGMQVVQSVFVVGIAQLAGPESQAFAVVTKNPVLHPRHEAASVQDIQLAEQGAQTLKVVSQ